MRRATGRRIGPLTAILLLTALLTEEFLPGP
jgi:hypothetical protein